MRDLERELTSLGARVASDTRATTPLSRSALRRIRTRRIALVAMSGLTMFALIAGVVSASGLIEMDRAGKPAGQAADESGVCDPPVGFKPTFLPRGWVSELQPGTGLGDPSGSVIGHYGTTHEPRSQEKMHADFIDVAASSFSYELSSDGDITVLGLSAKLDRENGTLQFVFDDCTYMLVNALLPLDDFVRFAEGLRETDVSSDGSFGAIWPQDSFEQAQEACLTAAKDPDSPRNSPMRMAIIFSMEVLNWTPAETLSEDIGHGAQRIRVRRGSADDPREPDGPAVLVTVNEVLPDCWSIWSVSRTPKESDRYSENEGASVSVHGRNVTMYFADFQDAATATLEVGYGGQVTRHEWQNGDEIAEWRLDFEPQGEGHYLVLLRDENGEVFSAFGSPLPEGDFAAG